jgi:hypothetical protein
MREISLSPPARGTRLNVETEGRLVKQPAFFADALGLPTGEFIRGEEKAAKRQKKVYKSSA